MLVKLFWIALLAYVVLRGALYYVQYRGHPSPAARERAERYFTDEDIDRGFEYARRGFWARIAVAAVDLAALLLLLQTGLSGWLSDRCHSWVGGRWFLEAPLFVSLLVLGVFLLHLPFSYYFGHVLEQRFEFSTQTAGGWLVLRLKQYLVLLVLATVAALLWFGVLRLFPRGWVVAVPAAFTSWQIVLTVLTPLLILPLFYRASRLTDEAFRSRVVEVLEGAGIRVGEVFVIDASRYSRHTNAFFTGLGPSKNIYLYDTLLEDHSEDEALTVVAHEAGHWRGRHIAKGIVLSALALLAGCSLLYFVYERLAVAMGSGWRPLTDPGSLPALLLLALLGGFFFSPLSSAVSRSFEREADRAAVSLTGAPAAFVEAEKRLVRTNRIQVLPHPFSVFWFASHPPVLERIRAAEGES